MSLAVQHREEIGADSLDAVFFALSDPVRRAILDRLDHAPLLVSELAEPFDISLQGKRCAGTLGVGQVCSAGRQSQGVS